MTAKTGVVLITGATGNTGSGIAGALLAKGYKVRALVRDAAKAGELKKNGVELVVGDLEKPETLTSALFEGVTKAYLCTWNGPTGYQQSKNFLDAVKRAGVRPHIVRLSAFGAPESRIIVDLRKTEADLKASGLPWTILQPTFFMQNIMMTSSTVKDQGAIYWDWADGKAGIIDVRDIVDAAVAVLTSEVDKFEGKSFVLTGPTSVGFADVARTLSKVIGKDVRYVAVPHDAAKQSVVGMGIPQWIADGYAELSAGFARGFADRTTDHVQRLTGHAPRSFEHFARDFKAVWGG